MLGGGKVGQPHSCVLCVEGPPRLLSLYFIVREKKGREMGDMERCRGKGGGSVEAQDRQDRRIKQTPEQLLLFT